MSIRLILSVAVALFFTLPLDALSQDTTTVQTFTFSDITKRRGVYEFPASTESFRKILMYKTLKCDAATTQDNYPCGEWDYLTYTFVYDHTGVMDSTQSAHPFRLFGGYDLDTAYSHNVAMHDVYQWQQNSRSIDSVISENSYNFYNGSNTTSNVFSGQAASRFQFLIKSSALTNAGLAIDTIDRITFDINQLGGNVDHLTIRLRNYTFSSLNSLEDLSLTTVYDENTSFSGTGLQTLNLTTPFVWNGASNLLVDISYTNAETSALSQLIAGTQTDSLSLYVLGNNDGYAEFGPDRNRIEIPLSNVDFEDEITVSFWANGDADVLPANTSIFEGVDFEGDRSVNVHLPWSNGSIYWDAGSGSGYDRINKAANAGDYEGKWNHWAFTKNAATGQMKIYLNGSVWKSGGDLNRSVGKLKNLIIGSGMTSNPFYGKVDEFQVWKKELTANEIANWMNKDITNSHPSYSDLMIYFKFDDGYNLINSAPGSIEGFWHGSPRVSNYSGDELFRAFNKTNIAPSISFSQGQYESSYATTIHSDTIIHPPYSIVEYAVNGNFVDAVSASYPNPQGWTHVYNPSGQAIDSTYFAGTQTWYNSELTYFLPPFEVVDRYEIGRFITPYGIGLSLGNGGFTWVYDVTDYAFLLHDSVDISSGNQQELLDLKFVMIEGTPPAKVVELTRPWGPMRSISYAALDDDVALEPITVNVHPDASRQKVLARLTGHGHNSNNGSYPHCCEWKDNTHFLYVNNSEATNWHIWQTHECALNPVYPQGGTWPGAREGWCPGDVVKDYEYDITSMVSGSSYQLDYRITPVPSTNVGMGNGNYVVAMHVFQYDEPAQTLDAEIYNVIKPSNVGYYSRMNPVCFAPTVVLRNNGSTPLTSAKISYKVAGGLTKVYNWTGSLGFLEKEEVELPFQDGAFYMGNGSNKFIATVSEPNGGTDGNEVNNSYTSSFNLPPVYEGEIIIQYKRNTFHDENNVTVYDSKNQAIFSKVGSNLAPNTIYWDTLTLDTGCYRLEVTDSEDDGLSYWAWPDQGSGYIRIWNDGGIAKSIESEFGNKIDFAFAAGAMTIDTIWTTINDVPVAIIGGDTFELINGELYPLGMREIGQASMNLYPNPSSGSFYLELLNHYGPIQIQIHNVAGQLILNKTIQVHGAFAEKFQLKESAGVYFVTMSGNNFAQTRKMIIER